jgi:hypothetical protein
MDMKHKNSQVLFGYWNEVRGERITPRRFEIDPSKIAGLLPSTFILERVDAETYRFRLAGTRVCELFGYELRGSNFLHGWSAIDRSALVRHFNALAKQGAVELIQMEAAPMARPSTPFEVILLPLQHTGETIDRILGAFSPLQEPHWLGELPLSAKRIISHELFWPAGSPRFSSTGDRAELPMITAGHHARVVRSKRRQFRVFEGGLGRGESDEG